MDVRTCAVYASIVALLFAIFSLPLLYKLTNMIFEKVNLPTMKLGAPTYAGIVLHAIVAGLVFLAISCMMNRD
jgi:hypothetical protein